MPICLRHSFCILIFNLSAAQTSDIDNKLIVTVAPLALADVFDGASARAGVEVKISRNMAVGLESGPYLNYLKATKISPKGFLIRPSLKYYLNRQNCSGRFIALEYQFKQQAFDFIDSIALPGNRYEKQYNIQRKVHSIVFKYGGLKNIGTDFILEWYCGIGIRHNRSFSDLSPAEEDGILSGEAGDCPLQEDIIRLTGTRIFPDFRAGIKIGCKIF